MAEEHSTNELDTLFELSVQMLCVAGTDGYFKRINPAWTRTLGYSVDELLSKPFTEFVHPDDREATLEEIKKLSDGQPTVYFENRYRHRDGSYRWFAWASAPVTGGLLYACALDVTGARADIELLAKVLDAAPDAMIITRSDGTIHMANRLAEQLFGTESRGLLGKSIEALVPQRLRKVHKAQRDEYMGKPVVRAMGSGRELIAIRSDGVEFPAEISLGPLETGEELFTICAIRNITARIEERVALRASEERLSLAIRASDAGIWEYDLNSGQVFCSPSWKAMLGYEETEIGDDHGEWESRLHPADRSGALKALRRFVESETHRYEDEFRLLHKDGSYRSILARGEVVWDPDTRSSRLIGSHIDVSPLREKEKQLNEQNVELVAAEKIQTALLPKKVPVVHGLDLAGKTYPADLTGGDLYDFILREDGYIDMVLGDVSGHGVSAALLMATTHAYMRALHAYNPGLCALVTEVHSALVRELEDGRFVTCLIARLDVPSRVLTFVNAGHPPGYVLDASGSTVAKLESSTWGLGMMPDIFPKDSPPILLNEGDLVLLMSDGLIEAMSPSDEEFGLDRILETVRRHLREPAAEIIEALHQAVIEFTGRQRPEDDITIVIFKRGHKAT